MSEENIQKEIREIQQEIREEQQKIERLEEKEERLIEREREEHHLVKIKIDKEHYDVKRGPHSVRSLKELGHVPESKELDQVINGVLTELPDNGTVEICGGEVFVSHARRGGSSRA